MSASTSSTTTPARRSAQRVTIHPREAAALDRLLDAYLVTAGGDPGMADLATLRERISRLEHDHTAYDV